ncbi:MAG: hypothetical protein AAGG45_06070 [Pseudomonadota bacterium]
MTGLIDYTDLTELGRGAQITLLGLRSFASGGTNCCCLNKTYQNLLGEKNAKWTLGRLHNMAHNISEQSRRHLKFAVSGCVRITYDEASILGAISASQDEDDDLSISHLTWLIGCKPGFGIISACEDFGGALNLAGLIVPKPEALNPAWLGQSAQHFDGPHLVASAM